MTTRGVRNNNPGNIDRGKDRWQGVAADQSGDPRFWVFKDAVFGIRAICVILINDRPKGVDTVREIINRWAPPIENNTSAYVDAVAKASGFAADQVIDVDQAQVMAPLVNAIIAHENAGYVYPDATIREAMRRAGVSDAPAPSLAKKVSGEALAGASLGLGVVAQAAEPAKAAAQSLADFTGAPWIAHISTALLTLAGIAILATIAQKWVDHRRGL